MEIPLCHDKAGTCFVFEACVKKFLGICVEKEWLEEFIDLNDPQKRMDFIKMGFKLKRDD